MLLVLRSAIVGRTPDDALEAQSVEYTVLDLYKKQSVDFGHVSVLDSVSGNYYYSIIIHQLR